MTNNTLPQLIVIDTNIIKKLPDNLKDVNFNNLIFFSNSLDVHIYLPEIVFQEWAQHKINNINDAFGRANQCITFLNNNLDINLELINNITDYKTRIINQLKQKLELSKISIIQTSPNIDINELILKSIEKQPPFEIKGEKGFKDTIIIYTILHFMIKNNLNNLLFITEDNIFYDNRIHEYFKPHKITYKVVKSINEAETIMFKNSEKLIQDEIKHAKMIIMDFLVKNQEKIFNYILSNTNISLYNLLNGNSASTDYTITNINRVISATPIKITDVSFKILDFSGKALADNIEITFTVLINFEVDAIINNPFLNYLRQPQITLSDLDSFNRFNNINADINFTESNTINIEKEVNIKALLDINYDILDNLQLLSVYF